MSNEIHGVSKDLIKKINDTTIDSLEVVFGVIKEKLLQDLKFVANTVLEKHETIFSYYCNLEKSYKLILDKSDETINFIDHTTNKDIVNSIYSILSYQIVDMQKKNYLGELFLKNKHFIKNQVELFCINFDMEKEYFLDLKNDRFLSVSKNLHINNFNLVNFLKSEFKKNISYYYENIYKYYLETLNKTVVSLCTFISTNIDFFKKENEVFGNIILTKLSCLELELKNHNHTMLEISKITELIENLRTTYYELSEKILILEKYYKQYIEMSFIKDSKDFCVCNVDSVFFIICNESLISKSDKIIEDIKKYITVTYFDKIKIKMEIENLNIFKYIYNYQNQISKIKNFSNDIINAFKELNCYFNENNRILNLSSKWKLVSGINESVEIKIQNLNENCEIFFKESLMLFDDVNRYMKNPDIINLNLINLEVDTIIDKFCKTTEEFDIAMNKLDEEFNTYIKINVSKYNDKICFILNKLSKKTVYFLKNILLFELCTFEEVYNYSVSILKQEKEKIIIPYIDKIDDILEKIHVILSKNNISIISPNEHDLFNAKEHEVILAEKNELFTKGQIIKVMNRGYKQNDVVIIRANVIAAK